MKHEKEFNDFLEKEVNLNPNRLETLHCNVQTVREFLQKSDSFVKVEQQGSYALKTIIKPHRGNEYDTDILLYIKQDKAKNPADYITEVHQYLRKNSDLREKAILKTRSISLEYPGDFHLDVVPCVTLNGNHYICNKHANKFEPTDGTAYRDWFNAKTDITSGHLKSVTRLLKYMRDHQRNFDVPSILLTTFIGNYVHDNETSAKAKAKFNTVPNTLLIVSKRINSFLQHTSSMPRIRNPKLKSERFTNRHWNQGDYNRFKGAFNKYYNDMYKAYHETNPQQSLRMWRALFGDNFGR